MKNVWVILMIMLAVSCGTTRPVADTDGLPGSGEVNKGGDMAAFVSSLTKAGVSRTERMDGILRFLASDSLQGRDTGSPGIARAADFIETYFEAQGVRPYFSAYRDTLSGVDPLAFNMVGVVPGRDPELKREFVVIGAHYDHIGRVAPVAGDSIANGANDNASGSTAVLELARYFGLHNTNARSLLFVLFSAEEKGLLGSKHLAERLKSEGFPLYVMLNYEMIGVPLQDKPYKVYVTGYEKSNLATVCNAYAGDSLVGFLPTAKKYGLFGRSDNYPFFEQFGVPSQTFSTFDFTNFDFYHQPGDEAKKMDVSHMARIVDDMIPVVEGIVNAASHEIKMN